MLKGFLENENGKNFFRYKSYINYIYIVFVFGYLGNFSMHFYPELIPFMMVIFHIKCTFDKWKSINS